MAAEPMIFIFTGTSGSGRKTIAKQIGSELGLYHVLSCTTRVPRATEGQDRDYHYISHDEFVELERSGQLLQSTTIGKERYGIRHQELDRALANGKHAYLILNSEGASLFKNLFKDRVIRIFIYVDKQTVRERLERKGTPYDVVDRYLDQYTEEVVYRKQCEHTIENVELIRTLEQIRTAINSHL
ncbi:hypothetical protein Back11_40470 [Paenibacillus baekrokdamisoli]|uniref:Uncharacterized protein n=1 Tax=Paenibacillus baekrokdamisoli TaxID=1712516 RepID=A0A3G9IWN6_9BACL|nr:AAA family ATPase [Paenibacillus baekrokdamisoli]MBB3068255.1 guanylate kinase [Paenibacillus baekrokdamisoli]BBH22702.1 hypothetical protein Back11_40470 [Paenibacillus baekrokdamisoli]